MYHTHAMAHAPLLQQQQDHDSAIGERKHSRVPYTLIICYCDAADVLGIYILGWRVRKMFAGCLPKTHFRALLNRFPDATLVLTARHKAHVEWVRALGSVPVTTAFFHLDRSAAPLDELHVMQAAERVMREKIHLISGGQVPIDRKYKKVLPLPSTAWEEEWMDWIDWDRVG